MGERAVRVWAWIAAAAGGDAPVPIAALCRAAVRRLGVDGASVTAMSGPLAREPVFASDEVSARLEDLQVTIGEGPCVDEFRFGSPVLIPDLESAGARWPGFVPAAGAAGARAVFAFPLQSGAIRVGVLSLYRAGSPGYQPLDGASEARAEVHQATGMISVQLGVSLAEAFARLRAHAFASNSALADVAGDVVRRRLRFDPDR